MAFVGMNPFPLRQIQNRRTFHLEKVRLELTELEAIRQTFLRERETSQVGRMLISDDEEDNWIPAGQHVWDRDSFILVFLIEQKFLLTNAVFCVSVQDVGLSSLACIVVHIKQPF